MSMSEIQQVAKGVRTVGQLAFILNQLSPDISLDIFGYDKCVLIYKKKDDTLYINKDDSFLSPEEQLKLSIF